MKKKVSIVKEEKEIESEELAEKGGVAMKIIGWLITLVGFSVLVVKAIDNFTGFAVVGDNAVLNSSYIWVVGLGLMIVGAMMLAVGREKRGGLEKLFFKDEI